MRTESSNGIVFFRWVVKTQKRFITFILILLFLQTALFVWSIYTRSLPVYVQLYENDKVDDPPALNEEYFKENEIITWTQELLLETFSWNYHNWKNAFNQVRPFYSEEAFKAFLKGVNSTLKSVQNQRGTLLCQIKNIPRIKDKAIINGIYQWTIDIPINLSLETLGGSAQIETSVSLIIQRHFFITSENPTEGYKSNSSGLIVKQIIMKAVN